ncbi:MAG: ECF-type sigma factor [Bythopirellula sp.]|nr:ECF-type sigma factor [Bythopirellula sp.]
MSTAQSVSLWIADLKDGDSAAAQNLWDRYAVRLVEIAQQRMKHTPRRIADEEDVAASVFHSLCRGAAAGRFKNIKNRDDLWWLLMGITKQKIVNHVRRETAQKRGGGQTQVEANLNGQPSADGVFSLDQLMGDEPTPEFVLMLEEEHERLMALLRDDELREIANLRIEGFTINEIAARMNLSFRTAERKTKLIRDTWQKELQS